MSAPSSTTGYIPFPYPSAPIPCQTWYQLSGPSLSTSTQTPLILLHGGPGMVHNYLLSLTDLCTSHSIPVIFFDQLGNGKSTHMPQLAGDTGFWTPELFMAQLESVIEYFGLRERKGGFDVLGQSWGGMLASQWACEPHRSRGLRRLVVSNSPAAMEDWVVSCNGLREGLPESVRETLGRCEREGRTDGEEYKEAVKVWNERHLCRVVPWPEEVEETLRSTEEDSTVYGTMNGPSEFYITGSLKTWSIKSQLHRISVPTLILNARYDEAQDSCVVPFFQEIPNAKWVCFENSSHLPMWEERERYMQVVGGFLSW